MAVSSTFLISTRARDKNGDFIAEPGDTTYLCVKAGQDSYSPADALKQDKWRRKVIAAADGGEDDITGATGSILFFVHGYNNDIPTVLWRTRTLQETLAAQGWRGLVVGFDWPSDNMTLNYLEDRRDAAAVSASLIDDALQLLVDAQFPKDNTRAPCTINVHLIGHSTGAYVIMEAFANAAKIGDYFKKPWRIGQVVFIGGDVASASLAEDSDWAKPMYNRIFRLTNYSNGFDKVLGVSNMKRLGTSPRAGRVGLPANAPRQAVNVDCASYFATKNPATSKFCGTFNHSWHIGDPVFALDLAMTLEGDIDRQVIPTRTHDKGQLVLCGETSRPQFQPQWDLDQPPAKA